MPDTYCDADYLPWLLAWDFNFLPDNDAKSENDDIGGDERMVFLASHTIDSKCLFVYNQEWGDFSP